MGYGVAQLGGDPGSRTEVATVNEKVLPDATGKLEIKDDGEDGAILESGRMPSLPPGRSTRRGWAATGSSSPSPPSKLGADGSGAVAVRTDLSQAGACTHP